MRVLHIIPSLRKGGAERLALDICIELSKRQSVEVALVALHNENAYPELSAQINYQYIPARYIPSLSGKATIETTLLDAFIESFKPDVIHSHLFEAEMVSRYNLVSGVKYFTHCHDNMHQLRSFSWNTLFNKRLLTEYYERYLILERYRKCNNSFIAISRHTEAYFKQVLPAEFANRIYRQHNAINFKIFNRVVHDRTVAPIRLVNTGSFVAKKNQSFLIDVVKYLVAKDRDVELTLLGDGPLREQVISKVRQAKLERVIHLPGNVSNVPEYLRVSNVYVHSATYEPFGLVLIEAMAAGLPVVCLNGGGNADLIEQQKNGVMLEDVNPVTFAEAILKITEDQHEYNSLSRYAIEYAKRFDIDKYTDDIIRLYNG